MSDKFKILNLDLLSDETYSELIDEVIEHFFDIAEEALYPNDPEGYERLRDLVSDDDLEIEFSGRTEFTEGDLELLSHEISDETQLLAVFDVNFVPHESSDKQGVFAARIYYPVSMKEDEFYSDEDSGVIQVCWFPGRSF
ncbi:MAG TPA: hypothetical protein DCR21_07745 [Succinivibrionaceae bacterium]|nr:hypothetical protein [Succinivibrionaceae bacterium]